MSENTTSTKKSFSFDWLIRGVLTKFGDFFDSLTGRRWKPSSSLATSELTEKLKKLLDLEVKDLKEKGKFVPHNLKLKMQWDKFSTDSEKALKTLENELLIAAIDHINDNRYQTYEPINLEVKPDYFTEGVKLIASFDKAGTEENEAAMNVTVPDIKVGDFAPPPPLPAEIEPPKEIVFAEFSINGKPKNVKLVFSQGTRRSVGRNKQNDLVIDDNSVSKIHAAIVLNKENLLQIADTGSTNGTFINDRRISYGKAETITDSDNVKFGTVEVSIKKAIREEVSAPVNEESTIQKNDLTINPDLFKTNKENAENGDNQTLKESETVSNTAAGDEKPDSENKNNTGQGIVFDFENQSSGGQK